MSGPRRWLLYPSFVNPLCIRSIFRKLNCYLPTINNSPIQSFYSLLRFISILIAHKSKTSRFTSPPIFGNEDIDNLAVLVKKRKQIIGGGTEGDVENEERVGIGNVWRAGLSEVRHDFSGKEGLGLGFVQDIKRMMTTPEPELS